MLDFIEKEQTKQDSKALQLRTLDNLKNKLKKLGQEWRDEHTKVNKNGEEKVSPVTPRLVADILKKECVFILIDEDNPELAPLAVYDPDAGIYRKGERFINRLAMKVERTLTEQQCKNVRHYLTTECNEKKRTEERNLIVVNNGIYNRETGMLEPFSSDYVFVNKVATNYVKNAPEPSFEDWKFSDWINELSDGNASKEKLLWQLFAVTIDANYISEVAVFFLSEQGRTGKSTFQQLMVNLVGKENKASLKIKEFESDFKLASAYGCSLIIGDDNNPKDFNETSENFKSVVTGDSVLLNPKNKKPFSTTLTPFVVQSMNGLPRFKDITDGLQRRLRIILFNHSYKGTKNNRAIKERYIHNQRLLEFILSRAITMKFEEVEDTTESQEAIHELVLENSAVVSFFEEMFQELESERLPVKFLFELFQSYCDLNNRSLNMTQNTFTKEFKTIVERKKNWKYFRNSLAPLEYFLKSDYTKLREMKGFNYKYEYESEIRRKQPLLKRVQSNKATIGNNGIF